MSDSESAKLHDLITGLYAGAAPRKSDLGTSRTKPIDPPVHGHPKSP